MIKLKCFIILFCFFICFPASAKEVSLREKIGQMFLIGFTGTTLQPDDVIVKAIQSQNVGGVVLYLDDNIRNPTQLKKLTTDLQSYAEQAAKMQQNNLYPLLIGLDYEGGRITPLKHVLGFPKTLSAAKLGQGSYQQAEHYAKEMAETLRTENINLDFAPVVDLNINPESKIIGKLGRSFSSDPEKVVQYAEIFSKAFKKEGILCTYKHFPGHGSAKGDTHAGLVDVTYTWSKTELIPYKQLFKKPDHCPLVMTAHVVNYNLDANGYPASISHALTTKLLRKKLHFDGVIISDDLEMNAIQDYYGFAESIKLAVNAGADILLISGPFTQETISPQQLNDIVYEAVKKGEISPKRIDEAYQRIMKLKNALISHNV